jgi:phage terminase large subunit
MKLSLEIPDKLQPLFTEHYVIAVLFGGRSSGKTATIIRLLLVEGIKNKIFVLCCREYQASIEDSVYRELKRSIFDFDLFSHYTVKHDRIVGKNGTEFVFKGIARDPFSLKGIPKIDFCFAEEAETFSKESWDILLPTLYKTSTTKLLLAFNPREEQSDTYQRFVVNSHALPQPVLKININYTDNPFLNELALQDIEQTKKYDYAKYEHIYLGQPLNISEAVVYKGCFEVVDDCDIPSLAEVKVGLDFGYSPDPLAVLKIFVIDSNTIYIEKEIYENKVLPSQIRNKINKIMPEVMNKVIWADSARNDSIAELNQQGMRVKPSIKGKGSIESGIEFLRGKKILVNKQCSNTIFEFYNYKLKVDKNGTILPEAEDKHNHALDALRYSFSEEIAALKRKLKMGAAVVNRF